MSAGTSWRFHSDLSDELRKVAVDWARANGLDTDRVPFNARFTIDDGQLSTEYVGTDGVHSDYTPVTVPLLAPLPEPFASSPGGQHAPGEPWTLDVPEVPPHVTALSGRFTDGRPWLRVDAPTGFADWGGSWWASLQEVDGVQSLGPTVHITDIVSYAPLVECPDPRAAS